MSLCVWVFIFSMWDQQYEIKHTLVTSSWIENVPNTSNVCVHFFRFLYLEGTLYKFATNSQNSSYSKLHLRHVHHFVLSQRTPINGANYKCTKCNQEACWLQMDPVCSLHITSYKRASSEEKYHVLAITFKTVIHVQQMLWRKENNP